MATYEAGVHHDQDTGRDRWAVLDTISHVWYFPEKYGEKAAKAMAARLNYGLEKFKQLQNAY